MFKMVVLSSITTDYYNDARPPPYVVGFAVQFHLRSVSLIATAKTRRSLKGWTVTTG